MLSPGEACKERAWFHKCLKCLVSQNRHPLRSMAETIEISNHVDSASCPHIDGVRGKSCLASLSGFDFILDAPPDPLHQLYIGVTKRMMSLWFDRENNCHPWYVGNRMKDIDAYIATINIPSCMTSRITCIK